MIFAKYAKYVYSTLYRNFVHLLSKSYCSFRNLRGILLFEQRSRTQFQGVIHPSCLFITVYNLKVIYNSFCFISLEKSYFHHSWSRVWEIKDTFVSFILYCCVWKKTNISSVQTFSVGPNSISQFPSWSPTLGGTFLIYNLNRCLMFIHNFKAIYNLQFISF